MRQVKNKQDSRQSTNSAHQEPGLAIGLYLFGMEELDMDELTEVQQRYDKRMANKVREASRKKKIMVNLQREVKSIQNAIGLMTMYSPKKLIVAQLKCLCRWKKTKGDKPLLTKKADLIAVYRATVGNPSPQVSQ